ncbi:hypothetical protein [Cellulomonas citrea]|uniref:hypothetical protein n=1 Tax=Cellulomonas citrea TaxID=1909423 RepID=UPI00135909CF|nr:hypothetical protein [Cellulomonas citrea]
MSKRIVGGSVVAGMVVLLLVLGGCSKPGHGEWDPSRRTSATASQGRCDTVPGEGASPAAQAYAAAVNAAYPAWQAVDATIRSEGGVAHRDDLLSQVNADTPFVAALQSIDFPPDVAPLGQDLIAAVQAYDSFLMTPYTTDGYMAAHTDDDKRLNETRASSSHALRQALGLPASTCTVIRP